MWVQIFMRSPLSRGIGETGLIRLPFHRDWTLFATRGGIVGLNFLSVLVIAAVMSADDFGKFVYFWAMSMALAAIASLGGQNYLLREGSARQVDPARGVTRWEAIKIAVIWPSLALSAIGLLAISLPIELFLTLRLNPPQPFEVVILCAVSWVLILLSHLATPFRVCAHKTFSMFVSDAGPHLILLVVIIGGASFSVTDPYSILLAFVAVGLLVIVILAAIAFSPKLLTTPLWRTSGSARGDGLVGFWGISVLGVFSAQIDILLGAMVLNPAELGQYQILKRLANLASLPVVVANWAVVVRIGKAFAAGNFDDIQAACRRGAELAFFPGMGLVAALMFLLPGFLWFYNIENTMTTWIVFSLLATASIINFTCGVNFAVAAQCKLENFALFSRLIGLTAAVSIIVLLGEGLSELRLAAAMLFALGLSNLTLWTLIYRTLEVDTTVFCLLKRRQLSN